mmetsp:Transcript_8986/g.20505  ORF Transcript_8986/g.20505 Transcript_8986/m.20505 type:complete len:93 (-) Transcript_8986:135-413(-)
MWLRCMFSWVFAALIYGAVFGEVKPGTCSVDPDGGSFLCNILADVRLLASFVVGAGLCKKTLRSAVGDAEGGREEHCPCCCPEKVNLCSLSL